MQRDDEFEYAVKEPYTVSVQKIVCETFGNMSKWLFGYFVLWVMRGGQYSMYLFMYRNSPWILSLNA